MQTVRLPHSDLTVSRLCLGTMTWGEQNSEAEAHAQLDCALAAGINFIDTAEMYPVPAKASTWGSTERYLGSWLKRQPRDRIVLASKVAGPNRGMDWIRSPLQLSRQQIHTALEGSLQRLQTDYIDLYQLHWPARNVPMFGQSYYEPEREQPCPSMHEQLSALAELVQAGKIRYIGVSNETPWGGSEFARLAEQYQLPRIVSIQNVCNLINRSYEQGLAESCHRNEVALLAYSPLAFGLLSGKYADNPAADGRMTRFPGFGARYHKQNVSEAVQEYTRLARELGVPCAQLALAWLGSRWYVTSSILGATSLAQLQQNLASTTLVITPEIEARIEAIHRRYPSPAQ